MAMTPPDLVRERISAAMRVERYFPPADPREVDEVERELGVPFPDWLRKIYLACDGFLGPTQVSYLYRLRGRCGVAEFNPLLRREWDHAPWLKDAIIFADNGCGGSVTVQWGVLHGQLIEWCYGDDAEYRSLEIDIFELWAREQRMWDDLDKAP